MGISFWQILIVVALLVILFGRGKISELMGDVAKGVKSFKKGINDEDETKSINKSGIYSGGAVVLEHSKWLKHITIQKKHFDD